MRLLGKALTFDDVSAGPRVLPRPAARHQPRHLPLAQYPSEPAARLGSDGHRDRSTPGDRPGPGRRHRHRPQEPVGEAAGRRGGQGEALRVGRAARPDHGDARDDGARGDRAVEGARRLRLSGAAGQDGGRHRHQPRPAFRDPPRRAGQGHHDAAAKARHGARGRLARRRQGAHAQGKARARDRRQRRLRAARPDDGEGHHQADQLSERGARRAWASSASAPRSASATAPRSAPSCWCAPASTRSSSTPRTGTAKAWSSGCAG